MFNSTFYSIGKGKRTDFSQTPMSKFVPGPGAYSVHYNTHRNLPKWGFGSSKRANMATDNGAKNGPGSYLLPSKAIEGKHYTMGAINPKERKYQSISPGPGTY